jgi:murein DD-endopeptidase MepM/ murein hydrolase activator NlpD
MLEHAGRRVRIGPVAFWVAVGTLVVMAAWTLTTATYFAFRDDVLTRLIARQTEMQFGYEDRIADLRAQVDRISSRQLLDQEQYEHKLEQIVRRQTTLESRANALIAIPDPGITGSIKPPARGAVGVSAPAKPAPINDSASPPLRLDRDTRLEGRLPNASAAHAGGFENMLARLQTSLDRIENRQGATLSFMEQNYDSKARRMRSVLADLGLDGAKSVPAATGGPFVPLRPGQPGDSFEQQINRLQFARSQVERLHRTLGTVPVRKPLTTEIDLSSSFGVRIDPFTHSPAMHTGLDFHGDTGDQVRAAASGTVTAAGWSGGYGRMVEIDHGNGIATRYGHLSVIDAQVGQSVKFGQIIGRVGSTGRSTGPHLHYETRVDGEAVDPQKFLRAGARLADVM